MSTTTSTYLNRSTPGVYITEIAAFGSSIVGVPTAVPIFIGYTQFAGNPTTGASLYNTPVPISSMTEFSQYFGGAAPQNFTVALISNANPPSSTSSGSSTSSTSGGSTPPTPAFSAGFTTGTASPFTVAMTPFSLQSSALPNEPNQFNLYWTMQMFFANGGGNCFIVSVGSYWEGELPTSAPNPVPATWVPGIITAGSISPPDNGLLVGLNAAGYAVGPTMIVIPEACLLASPGPYDSIVQGMLSQARTLQDRVAIMDLPGCLTANTLNALQASQVTFANAIAPQVANVSYGAAYAPALNTSIVTTGNILYTNLVSPATTANPNPNATINNILTTRAFQLNGQGMAFTTIQGAIAAAFPLYPKPAADTQQYSAGITTPYPEALPGGLSQWQLSLDNLLLAALPVFAQIEQLIANSMNVLPPSGILAGVWSLSDSQSGVWNAPANIALASVVSPLYVMNNSEQSGFNMPLNGQAIDVIRSQPGRGNVVWGARTLDGNSNDYRYIQVRRTLIYVEQSIKVALQPYVFAANDATTWSTVTSAISSFLTGLWQQGGLMGAKASDAFTVQCGLGSTMTAQNILDGYMIVAVSLQMIHPAEFIELTFTQTMGT